MRSTDYLFRLIKALSKGDRRNFKLYAGLQDGDKQYIRLFDAIDKQSEYDEPKLLKQFEGEKFTNQFSVAKNYLYNYILKTLHIFRKDPKTELNALLHQVQILMGKNLLEQAQKHLRKAKHLAERQERFPEMLFILETERSLMQKREQSKEFEAFIDAIQQEEEQTVAKIANYQAYTHFYDQIHRFIKRSIAARDPELKSKVGLLLANPLMVDAEKALSIRAKLRRYDVLVDAHRLRGELPQMLENLKLSVATYDAHPEIRTEKALSYINAVSNLGVVNYMVGDKESSLAALAKLRAIPVASEEEEIHVFEKYFHFKLGLCIEIGDIPEARSVIADFEMEFPGREGTIMKAVELSIFYMIGYFYLYIGEPEKGLESIHRVLNEPRTELRTDIQAMARIVHLVLHYHLGNFEFLEYEVKSVARFLSNRDRLFVLERTILKYVRSLAMLGPNDHRQDLLREFKKEVEKVVEDPFERQGLKLFDPLVWIDAQLNGQTMWQIEHGDAVYAAGGENGANIRPPR
jgi:tetratricopeptide (TPR) repeat protein